MDFFRSKRFWFALLIFTGLLLLRLNPYLIMVLLFCIAFLYNAKTVRPLKNYKFWIVIIFLVLIVPLFTGVQDRSFLGINYSSGQLQKTMFMTLRGISVFLMFQVLTIDLDIEKIKPVFSKIGVKNFNILYSLSNKIFPKIKSILTARYTQFRVNWKNKRSLELIINFFSDIFVDFFLLIDQLSKSETDLPTITVKEFINQNDFTDKPCLIVIVGDPGAGKTPWVEQLIESLQSTPETVDGVISKKCHVLDDKWHHDLIRISTGKKRQLTSMDKIDTDIRIGKFYFYEDSIIWGNAQLKSIKTTDWVIVDEVGLLEFNNSGLLPGLQSAVANFEGRLVITVRSTLFPKLDNFIEEHLFSVQSWQRHIVKL